MRIGLVVPGGFDPGASVRIVPVLLSLVEQLSRRHEVHVFVIDYLEQPVTYPLCGATVHDLGRSPGTGLPRLGRQVRRLVQAVRGAGRFDVLHGYWAAPAGFAAALVGRLLRTPALVTLTGGELVDVAACGYGLQRHWQGRVLMRATATLASALHVPGPYMAELARKRGLHVATLPLGIDIERFRPPGTAMTPGPPWRLLQVASLSPVKDQSTLLQAAARLRRRTPGFQLDIVGEDTLSGRLHAEAAALGLEEVVRFHGMVPAERMPDFYRHAHLYVQSSRHEASGIAVLEAAACGLPIVGTGVGTLAELAPDAAAAVPVGDPDALAGAIADLLADEGRRRALGRAARARAEQVDAAASARALADLYGALGRQSMRYFAR